MGARGTSGNNFVGLGLVEWDFFGSGDHRFGIGWQERELHKLGTGLEGLKLPRGNSDVSF